MAAIGGWLFLGEVINPAKWFGVVIVASGVLLASGAFSAWIRSRLGVKAS